MMETNRNNQSRVKIRNTLLILRWTHFITCKTKYVHTKISSSSRAVWWKAQQCQYDQNYRLEQITIKGSLWLLQMVTVLFGDSSHYGSVLSVFVRLVSFTFSLLISKVVNVQTPKVNDALTLRSLNKKRKRRRRSKNATSSNTEPHYLLSLCLWWTELLLPTMGRPDTRGLPQYVAAHTWIWFLKGRLTAEDCWTSGAAESSTIGWAANSTRGGPERSERAATV